ncbi:MAG: AAA family ATPase [Thiofilum sp.]|uniref:ATP-dependent nuclease n=1 Tax=Thiofilum sp. TaxID=2212733 RepID=UPI0025D725E6|nr:AAA family ATPase [Thiofilum sp.]MBK8454059.1 ATP-binding protein [Thiofilum sp.]
MFSRIWSDQLVRYRVETSESQKIPYLDTKKVNFFVGSNNSGKSRLIRHLFSVENYRYYKGKFEISPEQDESLFSQRLYTNPDIPNRYYIPILRSLRNFNLTDDIYSKTTYQDYFSSKREESYYTGFSLYEKIDSFKRSIQDKKRKILISYEKLLSENFFDNQSLELIATHKSNIIAVQLDYEPARPIYDLGDGLQQIIIITSAAYLETEPSMFFIEEPEINLHPGMLRKLIHFLIDHTPHQYFITTHSNHLIDFYNYSDQVTVHRLKKKVENGQTTFTIHDCKQDKDLLQELGVLNTSVYLANSTIWVEGITDRLYLKAYMQKYLAEHPEKQKWQNYSEHIHYAFVEYQGGTLGHWDFNDDEANDSLKALKLCATPFLIADGDIRSKGNRYQTLIEQLGNNFFITEGKEFENMLPEAILKETAKHFFHNSRKAKDLQPDGLDNIKYAEYFNSQAGIGRYLDNLIGSTNNVFSEKSGAIRRKVEFCNAACEYMTKKDETTRDYANQWKLTDELKELCEKIFTHIERCNN